jgi:hypothetical protein
MTASILETFLSPAWISVWEWVEFISIVVVGIGCWGEVWAEHHKFKQHPNDLMPRFIINKKYERVFWLMVVFGLGIELIAFGFSFLASNREIEGLHRANLELQVKLQPRRITMEQMTNFITLCRGMPKMPIKIIVGIANNESEVFAEQVRQMLDKAGFGGEGAGIVRDPTLYVTREIGVTTATAICLVKNSPDMVVKDGKPVIPPGGHMITNSSGSTSVNMPVNQIGIVFAVGTHLKSVGITVSWMSPNLNQYLPLGGAAIFIPEKNM